MTKYVYIQKNIYRLLSNLLLSSAVSNSSINYESTDMDRLWYLYFGTVRVFCLLSVWAEARQSQASSQLN